MKRNRDIRVNERETNTQKKETQRYSGKSFSPPGVDAVVVLTTINSITTRSKFSAIMVQSHDC